jgi:hypothetical protein
MLICGPPECWFVELRYQHQLNGVIYCISETKKRLKKTLLKPNRMRISKGFKGE